MLKQYLLLALLGLTACGSLLRPEGARKELSPDEPTRLRNFLDEVYATGTDRARVEAALHGSDIEVSIWDSLDPTQLERVQGWLRDCKKRLDDDFSATRAPEEFRLEKAAARQWIYWELADQDWNAYRPLLSEADGKHRLPARYLWQTMRPENLKDWQRYVGLLEQVPVYLGQLEATLRDCADRDTLPPKQVLRRARTACLNWLAGRPFAALSSSESPWLSRARTDLEQCQALTPNDRALLNEAIDRALTQKVGPAYQQLATTLDELRARAPEEVGAWARKDGSEWYAYRISRIAGENLIPKDLHEQGLAEVERLRGQVEVLLQSLGSSDSLEEYLKHLRENGAAQGTDRANDLLDVQIHLESAYQRCLPLYPEQELPLLQVAEGTNLASVELQPLEYVGGRRPRIELYRQTWSNLPRNMVPAWTFAEGVPGAHLRSQITLAQTSVPRLLRSLDSPSIEEGWKLYASRLALEFQLYLGPQDQVGQALLELWHAARLVSDTGMHWLHWTPEQAESFLLDNSVFSRQVCAQAVRDSIERPGLMCAPTIGLLQFVEIRDQTQARLGPIFNPNAFHRALLAHSVFPIKQIREAMMLWSLEQL